ncbi:MAG: hypothetical protein K2J39_01795 [Ruminococcus sp.]|nr:hypothetical protein [Ruminococcus sp.]
MSDKSQNNKSETYSLVKAIVIYAVLILLDIAFVIGACIFIKNGYKVFGVALLIADVIFKVVRKARI